MAERYWIFLNLAWFLLVGGSYWMSLRALVQSRRRWASSRAAKRCAELELRILEVEDLQAGTLAAIRKINARSASRAAREKAQEQRSDPDLGDTLPPDEWKKRMRLKLARGELKP